MDRKTQAFVHSLIYDRLEFTESKNGILDMHVNEIASALLSRPAKLSEDKRFLLVESLFNFRCFLDLTDIFVIETNHFFAFLLNKDYLLAFFKPVPGYLRYLLSIVRARLEIKISALK